MGGGRGVHFPILSSFILALVLNFIKLKKGLTTSSPKCVLELGVIQILAYANDLLG